MEERRQELLPADDALGVEVRLVRADVARAVPSRAMICTRTNFVFC